MLGKRAASALALAGAVSQATSDVTAGWEWSVYSSAVYGVCAAVGGLAELVWAGSAKLSGINRNVSYQPLQTVSFATLPVLLEKDKVITVSFKRAESS